MPAGGVFSAVAICYPLILSWSPGDTLFVVREIDFKPTRLSPMPHFYSYPSMSEC